MGFALRYLFGMNICSGEFVLCCGPMPGGCNDLNLLHSSQVLGFLQDNEYMIADGIFEGQYHIHTPKSVPKLSQIGI